MKPFAFMLMFILITSFCYGEEKTISICSYEWLPHHGESLTKGGYTAELITEIFEPQGYTITKVFYPWKRALDNAKKGVTCDAITEIYFNNQRLEDYWYGVPYSIHEVYVMALKSHPLKNYNNLHDLKNYSLGYNRGGSPSKEFDAADYLNKQQTSGYTEGINMLLNKRFDFFVSAKSVALYEANKLGHRTSIHPIGKPLQRQFVHMAFSKKNPQNKIRMQDYNQGLFLLFKSGRYDEIMKSHGF